MKQRSMWMSYVAATIGLTTAVMIAQGPGQDFGRFVERELADRAPELLGIVQPLPASALGPFSGDAGSAIDVADNLQVRVVSTAVDPLADMIAMWPDDAHPTHLFVCIEGGINGVQRVDLSRPAASNATTIVTGTVSCDPIRRTPWGTILFGEEASNGGISTTSRSSRAAATWSCSRTAKSRRYAATARRSCAATIS